MFGRGENALIKSSLSGQLLQWARQFSDIAGEPLRTDCRLWDFLAQRLLESGFGGVEEDEDVIKFRIGGSFQSLRVVSWDAKRQILNCEFQGPVKSQYIMRIQAAVRNVHRDDKEKLADLLDAMEAR